MKLTAEEKETIAVENEKLIYFMVNKFQNLRHIEREEMISAAHLGFTRALNAFDTTKGVEVSTFICNCIEREIIRLIDYYKKQKRNSKGRTFSIDDMESSENQDFHDVIGATDKKIEDIERDMVIAKAVSRMCTRRGMILEKMFEGKTQTEIGLEMGIKRSNVRYLVEEIRVELKKEMERTK